MNNVSIGGNSYDVSDDSDCFDELKIYFENNGWKVLKKPHKNENGPDMVVVNSSTAYRIEIKVARRLKSGSWQVNPVEYNRRKDDFIAIKIGKSWLFRTMEEHLKLCSEEGYDSVTELYRLMN